MDQKTPTIMFACPVYGALHRKVYQSHLAAIGALAKNGMVAQPISVVVSGKMGLASAENQMVEAAMQVKPDYVFWTEMDMVIPSDAIVKLVQHSQQYNLDVVSGVYFLRGSGEPCLYIPMEKSWTDTKFAHGRLTTFPENSLFKVGCAGMGCILTKTSVFEKLSYPYFDDQEGKHGTDIYFATMLREAGVQVWADSSVICEQIDDDEPQVWGRTEYDMWLIKEGGKGGFIWSNDRDAIKLDNTAVA